MYTLVAVVAGVSVIIIIALSDLPCRLQDSKMVSLIGQIEYLPLKHGLFAGTSLDTCVIGFKNSDGRLFAFRDVEQPLKREPELVGDHEEAQFQISGQFSYGPIEQYKFYDITGMVQVDSVLIASPPAKQ